MTSKSDWKLNSADYAEVKKGAHTVDVTTYHSVLRADEDAV